jgi:hypothetical protein
MTVTFVGIQKAAQFTGTVERGAQSETFDIAKYGVRPYWDLAATLEADFNNVWRWLGQPQVYRSQGVTTVSGTDRLTASNINGSQTRADGFWNGKTVRIYTVASGVRSLLAEATVTATKVDLSALYSGTNKIVTGTSFESRLENFWRPSVGYWFSVAAINGSGEIGTRSSWVQYTAPASIGTSTASNTLSDLSHSTTPSALSAPTGVGVAAKGGDTATAVVTWGSVGGASGYVVYISYQDPTLNTSPEYLDIDTSGLSIPVGAVFILDWTATAQTDKWCSRIWAASGTPDLYRLGTPSDTGREWTAYTGGDPAPTGIFGLYYWRRTMTGAGNIFKSEADFVAHAGQRQTFYKVLEANVTYRARVLMRANTSITATLTIDGVTTGGSTACNLTTSWLWYTVDFSRTSVHDNTTLYFLNISVPGAATVDVAALEVFDPALDRDDFANDVKSRVSAGLFLRDHTLVKPGNQTASMRQALSPHGQTCRAGSVHNLLRKCHINDCKPWIQLEWHLEEDDWLDFVAYMAAPVASNHPMALMRQAQGQTTPWVDVFPEIIVEFGNEAWNPLSGFWTTVNTRFTDTVTTLQISSGASFGAHAQAAISAMKSSTWWRQLKGKTLFYGSGWDAQTSFELDAIDVAPDLNGTGYAGYNRGYETADDGYNLGDNGANYKAIHAHEASVSTRATRHDNITDTGASALVYEANLNYDFGDAFTIEVVLKSRGAGTGHLAGVSVRAAAGLSVENYFVIAAGDRWKSHAAHYQGGGTYMSWGLLKMIWDAVGRSIVRKIILDTPPLDGSVELLQAFEFKSVADPSNRVIVAVNRAIDVSLLDVADPLYNATPSGTYAMSIPTGIASCSGLKYYANVGNFRQHNRYVTGFRRTSGSGGQQNVADSLCVAFTYNWTTGTPLGDADPIDIDDTYGAAAGGLAAGNCVLLHLTGCVDA